MSSTTQIQNNLSATNLTMTKLELIRSLIQQYVPGVSNNIVRGLKSLGAEDLVFPCIMIQPVKVKSDMLSSGKYHRWHTFDIYWWAGDDNIEGVTRNVTDIGEILQKLFSNNALNDLVSGSPSSNKFKAYGSNWFNSEMSDIRYGPALYTGDKTTRPKYAALGFFRFEIESFFTT